MFLCKQLLFANSDCSGVYAGCEENRQNQTNDRTKERDAKWLALLILPVVVHLSSPNLRNLLRVRCKDGVARQNSRYCTGHNAPTFGFLHPGTREFQVVGRRWSFVLTIADYYSR